MAKSVAERLAELDRRDAVNKARRQAILARERQAERKADTRRKIILAGELLARAAHDERWAGIIAELRAGITRPADLAALEGWTLPSPSASPSLAPAAQASAGRLAVVTFPERPASEVTAALKAKGFRWNPDQHRWQGNAAALAEARQIAEPAGGAVELVAE